MVCELSCSLLRLLQRTTKQVLVRPQVEFAKPVQLRLGLWPPSTPPPGAPVSAAKEHVPGCKRGVSVRRTDEVLPPVFREGASVAPLSARI